MILSDFLNGQLERAIYPVAARNLPPLTGAENLLLFKKEFFKRWGEENIRRRIFSSAELSKRRQKRSKIPKLDLFG